VSLFRIAISNAVKLIPGWGSVVGASLSYASTWAFGKVANQYYASGGKLDAQALQAAFKQARKEGEKIYEQNKAEIAKKQEVYASQITELNEQLQQGTITQEQYQAKLTELEQQLGAN